MLLTQTFSAEDYFEITEKWGNHFEYVNGLVYWKHDPRPLDTETLVKILEAHDNAFDFLPPTLAMPTKKHDRLIANLQIKIGIRLQNTRFFAYSQAPNVKITEAGKYRVPDITIVEKEKEQRDEKNYLINPVVIIEVLSPSTADKDHNEKLVEYRNLPTLQEYILISQDEKQIEHYRRETEKRWIYQIYNADEEILEFSSVGIGLSVAEIYEGISFEKL